ncbi:hypothetical protein BJX99DRAFT_177313 [Aspergillus californicus]
MKLSLLSTIIVPCLVAFGMTAPVPLSGSVCFPNFDPDPDTVTEGEARLQGLTWYPIQDIDTDMNRLRPRQLQGGNLLEAIQNAGGLSGVFDSIELPFSGKGQ